jgi:ABC-2 type transport system ATP-binding protein
MVDNAISVENISINFGAVKALNHLSLEIPSGTIFGFLGPNGAGKTTTIRMLLGLLEPTTGKASVLGFDTRAQSDRVRANTGALLEHTGIYEQLSAEDNLEFYGRAFHIPECARRARIQELLAHLGLWERRKDKARNWSRGMKQKLALARTLLHRPKLVLLDEPTAGLDVQAAVAVREDLASLTRREQTTIFLTTHNMVDAEKLCHQIAVIREGNLIAVGTPDELRARTSKPQVEVSGSGFTDQALKCLRAHPQVNAVYSQDHKLMIEIRHETPVASLVNLLVDAGVQVEEVRRCSASLEEVFLALTGEQNA